MSQENDNTRKRGSKHLTIAERQAIERMLKEGANKREIARALRRDLSTIKREVKRGTVPQRKKKQYISSRRDDPGYTETKVYFADTGQASYAKSRLRCGAKNKMIACSEMVEYVESKVLGKEKWSPDAAIGQIKLKGMFWGKQFATKTFYNWIDDGLVGVKPMDLLLKVRRRRKSPRKERKRVLGKSIDERPDTVGLREEFGHWEGDGIIGKNRKGQLISLVERKLRTGLLFNVGDRDSNRIVNVLNRLETQYAEHFKTIFKTITFDNGSEFASSAEMERNGRTKVYYAHPYSAWERPSNENWNGIVRRFIPKGRNFDDLTEADVTRIAHYINTMPRKILGYKTPLELWNEQISAILSA